jgi:hypothetical protein
MVSEGSSSRETNNLAFHAVLAGCVLAGGMVAQETSRPLESPPNTQRLVGSEQETADEKQSPQQPEPSQPKPQLRIPVLEHQMSLPW